MGENCVHESIKTWLQSLDDVDKADDKNLKSTAISQHIPKTLKKRKTAEMAEDSSRSKRQRVVGLETPRASAKSSCFSVSVGRTETQSDTSNIAPSSRSVSPSKRPRKVDIEYGTPTIKLLGRKAPKEWRASQIDEAPRLRELVDCIHRPQNTRRVSEATEASIAEILEDVGQYKHVANEENWSDGVVLPTLRLAKRMSAHRQGIHVLNVKTIPVSPEDLLPTNAQIAAMPRKRVDYTIGLDITDRISQADEVVQWAGNHTLSQCQHPMIGGRVLCSHIEIKVEGGTKDAQSQLGVWCAAQFRKQDSLWEQTNTGAQDGEDETTKPLLAPIPIWLWQGKTVHLWVAVIDRQRKNVTMLDEKEYRVDEEDPESLLNVVGVISRVMQWSHDDYIPWFRSLIGRDDLNTTTIAGVT